MQPFLVERAQHALIFALTALLPSLAATAAPVSDVYSLSNEPIAPAGSVLLLPLGARKPGDQWPASISLTLSDGRTIDGTVVWISPQRRDPMAQRRWTDEAVNFAVRLVRPEDNTASSSPGAPYLVARLPHDGGGPIGLGGQTLKPVWRDPTKSYAMSPLPGPDRPRLPIAQSPDRPEPDAPFAYWRWVLLADQFDHLPPGTDHFDPVGALVAEHYSSLWRIALGRLGEYSLRVAQSCRDQLTRVCTDRPHRFAAWIAEPGELSLLLTGLLDFRKSPDVVVRDARAWIETRRNIAAWSEAGDGDRVRVAVVNRGFLPSVLRIAWENHRGAPITVDLPPGELTRVTIDRPPAPAPTPLGLVDPGVQQHVLTLRAGIQTVRVLFGPRKVAARPPGAVLPAFRPPLMLNDIESERFRPIPDAYSTLAHLRRRDRRWELFVDARRPAPISPGSPSGTDTLSQFAGPDEVAGVEAITIVIGPRQNPTAVLAIPETGSHRLMTGHDDGLLSVHRQSWGDRWYCRVVLPDGWVGTETRIGCRRSHGDGAAVETSPSTSAPWCQDPGRSVIDLSQWDR